MRVFDIIKNKRDGKELSKEQIKMIIKSFTASEIPEYQISALLMAIYFNGLNMEELFSWTNEMIGSGEVIDLSHIKGYKVDKHSTGGVGDKISIPLAPIAGACGVYVPMISGRGLGHTGGTLDKLESIPGFAVNTNGDSWGTNSFAAGIEQMGTLQNRWNVYKNPYQQEDTILLGYRGTQFLETGAVYAPYIPLLTTPLVYDPNTFTPRKGVMTRYAKEIVRPEFYGKIIVGDSQSI